MPKTKPKEFRWGTHFKNGKLYVFDKGSVLVARPWPDRRPFVSCSTAADLLLRGGDAELAAAEAEAGALGSDWSGHVHARWAVRLGTAVIGSEATRMDLCANNRWRVAREFW